MTELAFKFESATVVLVGLCNEEPLLQSLIGIIVFRNDDSGQLQPNLIDLLSGEEVGSAKNPFKPTFLAKRKGEYMFSFPDVGQGHGVMIRLYRTEGKYDFVTGINSRDSGSSGPLSNGGPELADALDEIFGFTNE